MSRDPLIAARLQPVTDELLSAAHRRAAELVAAAEADAALMVAQATQEAESCVGEAAQEGVRAAERTAGRRLVRAHREAREAALAARRAAYESLRTLSLEGLADRLQQPGYRDTYLRLQLGLIVDRVLASEMAGAV